MTMRSTLRLASLAMFVFLIGCTNAGTTPEAIDGSMDGRTDSGEADSGPQTSDSGLDADPDAARDAGPGLNDLGTDAGIDGSLPIDGGLFDAATLDTGTTEDSSVEDAGAPDAGDEPDAFVGVDAGPVCGDCDDGDPCTIDRCLDTGCDHYAVSTLLSGVDYADAYARNPTDAPLPLSGYELCAYTGGPGSPTVEDCADLTTIIAAIAPHTDYVRIYQSPPAGDIIQVQVRTPSLVMCDYVDRLRTNRSPGVHTSAVSLGLWTGDDLQAGALPGTGPYHDYCATTLEASASNQWMHCNLCEPRWTSCP